MAAKLRQGFYWRGSVIWVRTDPVTRREASTRCHDPTAAYLWRAERERRAADPVYAASLAATIGGWVSRTLELKTAQRRAGTLHMYRVKLGHVVRLFGAGSPLSSVTPGAIDEYIATRSGEGVVNGTIHKELACLFQLLKLAKRAGEYAGDLSALKPVGFSLDYTPTKRTLARDDLPKLWAALPSDVERAWVAFMLATAADIGDVERARPEDWDAVRGVMRVRGTKTSTRDAFLPVADHMRPLFDFALARLPVSWPRASAALGEACRRAGIPHLSPKDLRRTAASLMVAGGADISLVSRFLRHTSDAMVRKVYGQVTPEELGTLLNRQTNTETLQVPEKHTRPLGGIGRHWGLKRPFDADADIETGANLVDSRASSDTSGPVAPRQSVERHTEALQGFSRALVDLVSSAVELSRVADRAVEPIDAAPRVHMVTVVRRRRGRKAKDAG